MTNGNNNRYSFIKKVSLTVGVIMIPGMTYAASHPHFLDDKSKPVRVSGLKSKRQLPCEAFCNASDKYSRIKT